MKARPWILIVICLVLVEMVTGCNFGKKFADEEQDAIDAFLEENRNLNFQQKPSGLYYLDVVTGTGLQAETHDTAYVFYNMKFLDGTLIETNAGSTDTLIFPVNEGRLAVKGFDEGITYMKEGGQAMFLVPSKLAFGESGTTSIGSYTPLLFDAYLVKVKKYNSR